MIRHVVFDNDDLATRRHRSRTIGEPSEASEPSDDLPFYDLAPARKLIAKHHALQCPYTCQFGDASLEIPDGVFCPTLAKAPRLLLDVVRFQSGEHVLDVFSGSGAFGINAALAGATVVTVDISPTAVTSTRRNAALNHVEDRIDTRLGTMAQCLSPGERFDLVIANPPLLPGEHSDALSSSIFDPGLQATLEFIRALGRHLTDGGRCYLVTSDVIERYGHDVDRLCFQAGLSSYLATKRDVGYETYRVHELVLRQVGDA
jgi:methylase of polypeptide subunit release factors